MERRAIVKTVGVAGTVGLLGLGIYGSQRGETDEKQADETSTDVDEPNRTRTKKSEPHPIDTPDRLVEALESSTEGDVVTIPPDTELDLTGRWEVTVPPGVTLTGSRPDGGPGALLKSPEGDETPAYDPTKRKLRLEKGARLIGFRIKGHYHQYVNPEEEYDGDYYAHNGGSGLAATQDTEVANNEISGWPYAAIIARGNAYIHDNNIHHNTWEGLGYGIAVPGGNHMPVIESNFFNYNRHSITGAGGSQTGYIARYNVVGPDWVGSQFDMHGSEGMDGIAGGRVVIGRNTFQATSAVEAKTRNPEGAYPAVDIRGTPTEGVWIRQNWFFHDDRETAVRSPDEYERIHFSRNHYGRTRPAGPDVGAPESKLNEDRWL